MASNPALSFKAPGADCINGYVVSPAFPVVGDLLLNIFNVSLNVGLFPQDWKIAIVLPLHKNGPLDNPSNFRPIALLHIFGL